MTEPTLKHCPFCGQKQYDPGGIIQALHIQSPAFSHPDWCVDCDNCGALGPAVSHSMQGGCVEAKAAALWNNRAGEAMQQTGLTPGELVGQRDALLEALVGWKTLHDDMIAAGGDLSELPSGLIEQFGLQQARLMIATHRAIADVKACVVGVRAHETIASAKTSS